MARQPTQPLDAERFSTDLLAWYDVHRRRLPWREAPSLYKTVVSEFMLQQTQVKTALPYFERWQVLFPDFGALARASEAEVMKAWEGLGYYTRARNLRKLALAVVERGGPPTTSTDWLELPGIGPYTAAAISSIALGERTACVDGNVVRILARLTADSTVYPDSSRAAKIYTPLANGLVPAGRPGDHNQAMMELGATLCQKHNPLCTVCPVLNHCAAARLGIADTVPKLAGKTYEQKTVDRILLVSDASILLHRAGEKARRLAHIHELPDFTHAGLTHAPEGASLIATKKRSITRFQITERIWQLPASMNLNGPELVRVALSELSSVTLSGPHRRWLDELLSKPQKPSRG